MNSIENSAYFWQKTDTLVLSSKLVSRYKKGDLHPVYKNLRYPTDVATLKDTGSVIGKELEVFVGSKPTGQVDTIAIVTDILDKTIEAKLILRCTAEEEYSVLDFLNKTEFAKAILIRRGSDIPTWGTTD